MEPPFLSRELHFFVGSYIQIQFLRVYFLKKESSLLSVCPFIEIRDLPPSVSGYKWVLAQPCPPGFLEGRPTPPPVTDLLWSELGPEREFLLSLSQSSEKADISKV